MKHTLPQIILDARLQIARALVHGGGPDAALAAVAAQSIRLSRHVAAGDLLWQPVFRNLLQVAVNLRLVDKFGKRAVQRAIYAGPNLFSDIAEAA